MIVEAVGVALMFGVGWFKKHRTKLDHKKTGVATNAALAFVVAGVSGMLAEAGGETMTMEAVSVKAAAILATVETVLNTMKSARHAVGK